MSLALLAGQVRADLRSFLLASSASLLALIVISAVVNAIAFRGSGLALGALLAFGLLRALTQPPLLDWLLTAAIALSTGTLFTVYRAKRCSSTTGIGGLSIGSIAATCPACLAPLFGVLGGGGFLVTASYLVKLASIALILGSAYWMARFGSCELPARRGGEDTGGR